jgi:putative membrane protein
LSLDFLPAVDAALNTLAAVFLICGYAMIRTRKITRHRACMLGALASSAAFLACYTVYHAKVGSVHFTRGGLIRPVYFTILITHVSLAATVLPLALLTATRGLRGRYPQHVRIARWTLPIWLYVSVTGVLVYVLLYHSAWLL